MKIQRTLLVAIGLGMISAIATPVLAGNEAEVGAGSSAPVTAG